MSKPKTRSHKSLARRTSTRQAYDRVLIVCEGEKTEPTYLSGLIQHYRLSSANIRVVGDGGAAPISVVKKALELFAQDPDYNAVFCVFDRDSHESFERALKSVSDTQLIRRSGNKKLGHACLEAITSIPCFEYWVLLHYYYTTAPMRGFSDVERLLRQKAPHIDYAKSNSDLFACTRDKLEVALANAANANNAAKQNGTDNPTTQMPNLICYLRELARKGNTHKTASA